MTIMIDSIEDIEQIFRTGELSTIKAVLTAKALRHVWTTWKGLDLLGILHSRNPKVFPKPPECLVQAIYEASDAAATKWLFSELKPCGIDGRIATELYRACKSSERAKKYRGREFRDKAYDRKQVALNGLCAALAAGAHGWGWGVDDEQPMHKHVLYVDLPTGQVSFHSPERGQGPDYGKSWDSMPGQSAGRICRWIDALLVDVSPKGEAERKEGE